MNYIESQARFHGAECKHIKQSFLQIFQSKQRAVRNLKMKQRILRNFQIKQRFFHGNIYQATNIKTEQRIR